MSLLRTLPSVAALCGMALFAAASAGAQPAPPPSAPGAAAPHGGMMRERMEHMRAEHLSLLHDALSIRPDQDSAWQAFVAATAPQPDAQGRGWDRERMAGEPHHLTTPEQLDRMQARMAEHVAAFQRHAAAVKTFYAALTPAQQRTFDALARLHGMHGGFGHEAMGMHGGMERPGGA